MKASLGVQKAIYVASLLAMSGGVATSIAQLQKNQPATVSASCSSINCWPGYDFICKDQNCKSCGSNYWCEPK
jgi:hypothetical protein